MKSKGISKIAMILALLNLGILFYWILGKEVNIYKVALVGAIYELLWLFMIIGLFLIPALSLFFWFKDRFSLKSNFLYTTFLSIVIIVVVILVI